MQAIAAPENTSSKLMQECLRDWAGDADMVNSCMKRQIKDYNRVNMSNANEAVKEECKAKYGNDYGMVAACLRNSITRSSSRTIRTETIQEGSTNTAPRVYVNGVEIETCSHGAPCHGQMMEILHLGN